MKKKEANAHRFRIIPIVFCIFMILAGEGFATETNRNSLITEQNSVMAKYEFSLDLTPIDSHTTQQLHLTPLVAGEYQQSESRPFVLTEVTSSPSSPQTIHVRQSRQLEPFWTKTVSTSLPLTEVTLVLCDRGVLIPQPNSLDHPIQTRSIVGPPTDSARLAADRNQKGGPPGKGGPRGS